MQKIIIKYNLLIILGWFIILYNPPILQFNTMHVVGAVSLVYLFFNQYTKVSGVHLKWLKYFAILLLYLLVTVLGIHNQSVSGALYPVYYLIDVLPFASVISIYMKKHKLIIFDALSMAMVAGFVQSILAVLAFVNPQIQSIFVNRVINYGGIQSYTYWATLRMYGFSNGLMFEMPIAQSVLSVIALYYSTTKGKKFMVLSALLFFSAIVNARVSFIIVVIGIIILIVASNLKAKKKMQIVGGIIAILIVLVLFVLPYISIHSPKTYEWLLEGLEDIIGIVGGDTSGGYFSYISNEEKYRIPDSILGILFGEGVMVAGGNASFKMSSDIGYINDIWLGGMIYVLIEYSMFFMLWLDLSKKRDAFTHFFSILSMALIVVLNFKGCIFTMNSYMNLFVVIHILLCEDCTSSTSIIKNELNEDCTIRKEYCPNR